MRGPVNGRFFLDSWRLAGLLLLVCAAISAHAAFRAIEDQAAKSAPAAPRPTGYEAQDHFPGAAALYAEDAPEVAPVAIKGATGTTELPDLPVPPGVAKAAFDQASLDATIRPAAAFSMANASATDRARALECLTTAIYFEAATEPDKGQQAVAQVILNRVRHPAFPATVCGVVYQGSEKAGCQFSFACDGSMLRGRPSQAYWLRAARVAAAALGGYVCAEVGLATHYHTYAVTPAWNRKLVMTAAIGAHFFHRWQGWWGTPAAFRQVYAGGEPFPGPHPRAVQPVTPLTLASTVLPPPTPQAAIQPAYAQSGVALPAPRAASAAPQSGDVLDRWKDAGKPLR
ncbi:cell wall hydrolase [Sphingomonas sp. CA1-15]|uniref:Cell wall hydrolase n=1 Tax=Sphingomonas immobilis TaxID=3063997 RepID=A0ABT9A2Q6_9SPHN|nr:cell wall hydrolase [Sphingomonas sp. CA1-15]